MKLPELKKRFTNKFAIRIIAGVLVVTMVGTGVSVYGRNGVANTEMSAKTVEVENEVTLAENDEEKLSDALTNSIKLNEVEIGKEETVYIIADNTGKATETIVSDHLINKDSKETLEDASSLSDITNVKGDETFTQNGNKVTWQADGNDIYYQGTSTAEAPISQQITYYLDGKEIAPDELAGKSGKVTIHFDYTNNQKVKANIDGEESEICVPFVAISGMVLDDSFSNVEVTNGKVIADGNTNMVVGYALPGLKDSLNVEDSDFSEDINIPDYFEVTANVENFSLDMTMTAVVNATNFISAEGDDSLAEVDDLLDTLTDATSQLKDGSGELADGLDTLQSKLGEFEDGINTLKNGISDYTDGTQKVADGIGTLKSKSAELSDGVSALNTSAKSLSNGIDTLDSALKKELSDEEKAKYASEAVKAVDAQFADDTNSMSYNNLKAYASATFYNDLSGKKDGIAALAAQSASATVTSQESLDQIANDAKTQVGATMQTDAAVQTQLSALQQALTAAAGQQYLTTENGQAEVAATAAGMMGISVEQYAAIYGDASNAQNGTAQLASGAASAAILKNAAAGTMSANMAAYVSEVVTPAMQGLQSTILNAAGTVAQETAKSLTSQVASQVAASVVDSIAAEAKDSIGESVASAAKQGAETAAATAVVTGIESTKANILSQIEAKQSNGYSLVSGASALASGTQKLADSVPTLISGITALNDGALELTENSTKLNDGAADILDATGKLAEGVDTITDGAHTLADGITEFNEEGINKIVNAYQGDARPLIDRIQAVLDAGADYQTYTDIADGVNGSVKFVYKTAAVKAEE